MAGRSRPSRSIGSREPQKTLADREGELLETTAYQTTATYDALNRIKRMQIPQDVEGKRRELRPIYNNAGGLEKVFLDDTLYVERIAYDAKGQRALIAYGNGVMTRYAYDPQTFRLKRLRSERYSKPDDLTYRPAGDALQDFRIRLRLGREHPRHAATGRRAAAFSIIRKLQPPVIRRLAQLLVSGNALNRRFDYDPIYRLLSATGRECDRPPEGAPWEDQPRCTDLTKARPYTEQYRLRRYGQHAAPGAPQRTRRLHSRVHSGDGQQPAAPPADRRQSAMTTRLTPTATCARRRPPATSSGTIATR